MTETQTSSDTRNWLRRALRVAAPVALVVLLAAPAFASRIVQVRVGNHPTFSRVVFELDSHAGYQFESRDTLDNKVMALTIDASSRDRDVISKSLGVGSVTIEAVDGKSLALITLRRDDLMIKEMILSNPPRIVLDFRYPQDTAPASEVASASTAAAAPVDDTPKPVIAEPAHAEPEPVAIEPRLAEPETVAIAEPEPAAVRIDDSRNAPIDTGLAADSGTDLAAAELDAAPPTDSSIGDPVPDMPVAQDTEPIEAFSGEPEAIAQTAPVPTTTADMPRTASAHASESEGSSSNTTLIAAAVAGFLLVGGVVFMMNRRGSASNDANSTAIPNPVAEDDAPAAVKRSESEATEFFSVPEEGFEMSQPESQPAEVSEETVADQPADATPSVSSDSNSDMNSDETMVFTPSDETVVMAVSDDGASVDDDATIVQVSEANTAAYSLSEVSTNSAQSSNDLFDEDNEGEKQMDMESSDLPAERGEFVATPTVAPTTGDSANSELSSMVQQLMTRLGTLETRLDESNEARERLERQVAAQSEELRVQRAAIARTQRALRSLSRTDEDQATEPALKDPSA